MRATAHLRVVRIEQPADGEAAARLPPLPSRRAPDRGDLALVTALFLLNLIPVAGELAGIGRWSPALVGFAAGALLLSGRELWSQLRARAGRKTERKGSRP